MYEMVRFLHIIAAMVFFGIPFCFGRWYRTAYHHGNQDLLTQTIHRFRILSRYLYGAFVISFATGLVLVTQLNYWSMPGQKWVHLVLALMIGNALNIGIFLRPVLSDKTPVQKTKRSLVIFSGLHHTLVTLLVFLMVFKPF